MKNSIRRLDSSSLSIPHFYGGEGLFFVSYSVFLLYMIFCTSFYLIYIDNLWKPVFVMCIGLLAVYELVKEKVSWKNVLIISVICLLIINIIRITGGREQLSIACLLLYMYSARDISFRKIARITMAISIFALAVIVLSAYIGIIPNYIAAGDRKREYLGFLYALYSSTLLSNITLLWVYLKKEKMTFLGTVLWGGVNLFFFIKTNSRLCFCLTILMLVIGLLLKKGRGFLWRRKLICCVMVFSFNIVAILSYWITKKYNSLIGWQYRLNKALGSRLSLGQESLRQIGISWFGIKGIKWVGNGLNKYGETSKEAYLFVDNYYIQVMQRFGLVFLILTLIVLTYAAYKAYRCKDMYLLCIFSLLAVHFMVDNLYMYMQYNAFWILVGIIIFSKRNRVSLSINSYRNSKTKYTECNELL